MPKVQFNKGQEWVIHFWYGRDTVPQSVEEFREDVRELKKDGYGSFKEVVEMLMTEMVDSILETNGITITEDDSQNTGYPYRVESRWTQFDTFADWYEARRFALELVRRHAS